MNRLEHIRRILSDGGYRYSGDYPEIIERLLNVADAAKEHRRKDLDDECLPIFTRTGTALDEALAALEVE